MYPQTLEFEEKTLYYRESDCFTPSPLHLVHAYPHPNYTIKMHAHQFYEINVITGGEGRHYIGASSLLARVGDVFIIPPEVAHGYFSHGALDICHVLLRADFFTRYREELSALPGFSLLFDIEPQLRRFSGLACNLCIGTHDLLRINEELSRVIRAEKEEMYAYQNVLTLGLVGKLGDLLRQSAAPSQAGELLRVMEYIKENLEQKLTLDHLSRLANMSKPTLNRHFREVLQRSPMQYVLECRLSKAKELLARGEQSKSEIAQSCGFFDVSHMNKYL